MGNREALLAAAKRCLYEKGYARTSARDIATAAGVSLAAIGYHYGSKEALLNAALLEAIGEWGQELEGAFDAETAPDADTAERFEAIWAQVIESFEIHRRLWLASFEVIAEIDRVPEVRRILADGLEQARLGFAPIFRGDSDAGDDRTAWAVGSFYQALMTGVLAQWLIDPEHAPSASDLALALRAMAADVNQTQTGREQEC